MLLLYVREPGTGTSRILRIFFFFSISSYSVPPAHHRLVLFFLVSSFNRRWYYKDPDVHTIASLLPLLFLAFPTEVGVPVLYNHDEMDPLHCLLSFQAVSSILPPLRSSVDDPQHAIALFLCQSRAFSWGWK